MYLEIVQLKEFALKYQSRCILDTDQTIPYKPLIQTFFSLDHHQAKLFIDDEYDDSALQINLLNLELALRSLVQIQDSSDFLSWCKEVSVNPNTTDMLSYYKSTLEFCTKISSYFKGGKIVSFISDMDFQLNAGAAQYLRNPNNF